MSGSDPKNVIVVGARRSGTTFLGRMLALGSNVAYIHEPFNLEQGLQCAGIESWYPGFYRDNVTDEQVKEIDKLFNLKKVKFKTSLGDGKVGNLIYDADSRVLFRNIFFNYNGENFGYRLFRWAFGNRGYLTFLEAKFKRNKKFLLIKDPFASFISRWLAERYDAEVVVVIRHPAAYLKSMETRGWGIDMSKHSEMKKIEMDFGRDFNENLSEFPDLRRKALSEWIAVNGSLISRGNGDPRFHFVTHENLCANTFQSFKDLYDRLGMDFTDKIQSKISRYTEENNKIDSGKVSNIQRNSKELTKSWRGYFSGEEIEKIENCTKPIVQYFYDSSSW